MQTFIVAAVVAVLINGSLAKVARKFLIIHFRKYVIPYYFFVRN